MKTRNPVSPELIAPCGVMKLPKKYYTILKWTVRVLSAAIILLGLPFYFGYGNPLPFIKPEYSAWDNIWLSVFPPMFIGLGLGWKFPKTGGLLATVPIMIGFMSGYVVEKDLPVYMFIPFLVGIFYIVLGSVTIIDNN